MLSLSVLSRLPLARLVGMSGKTTNATLIGTPLRLTQKLRPELGRSLQVKRLGICLHYDASVTDKGALAWLLDPACTLGYNFLVWDDGQAFEIIPRNRRASHAGVTKSSSPKLPYADNLANSAFYGVAIAAGGKSSDKATDAQIRAVAQVAKLLFEHEGWQLDEHWRFTTHTAEAWPRGRKHDCEGPNLASPVMTIAQVVEVFKSL